MAVVGADVDQLRALARNLTQAAERLEGTAAAVTARLSATSWQGPDAVRFRSQWQGESQALVRAVVGAMRTAAAEAERNANEQENASAASGAAVGALGAAGFPSATSGSGMPPVSGTFPDLLRDKLAPFVDIRDFLSANTLWPINNGFAIGKLIPEVGPILPLLDAIGLGGDTTLSPDDRIAEATRSLTDLGGGFLKDVVPGQFGYLAGVAVTQWGDVAYEVSKADFSPQAVQTTAAYISSDPGGAFDAAKDAVLGYVPKLISNLWP